LMLGGVHGKNEKQVFAELCEVIDEWVAKAKSDNEELPEGMAGKQYSGKFNLRLSARLHERLALAALKEGKSLNNYVAEVLERRLSR
ncbi:MAG: toxin-antitoxin system HicB family antitoxin, partial [Ottowia sp.]|nr:toxin-antitoxin system HicB family antitoxin [Ottowia sp.]